MVHMSGGKAHRSVATAAILPLTHWLRCMLPPMMLWAMSFGTTSLGEPTARQAAHHLCLAIAKAGCSLLVKTVGTEICHSNILHRCKHQGPVPMNFAKGYNVYRALLAIFDMILFVLQPCARCMLLVLPEAFIGIIRSMYASAVE